MIYAAVVTTKEGDRRSVEQEAPNRIEAGRVLRAQGMTVLSLEERTGPRQFKLPSFISHRISGRDKIMFARNLAAMLSAGMPLSRSLSALEGQAPEGHFKTVVGDLGRAVDRGETLSSALAGKKEVFPDVFVAMVRAGEESGGLPNALTIIADQLEKAFLLKKKIRGAMIYPAIIVGAMVLVGIVMLVFVVPTLVETFKGLGVELPLSTRILIGVSAFLADNIVLVLVAGAVLALLALRGLRTAPVKRTIDHLLIRLPGIAPLVRQINAASTARTLSSLIAAGVDMVEALTITSSVHANSLYREVLLSAAKQVQSGAPLSAILKSESKLYPVLLSSVAEVGEETGKLSQMLMNTAVFYEEEVDRITKNMSTIVEPVLMVIIGAGVGFFSVSMISPMYSIVDTL